jgi:serine/threonine protein kinase
VEPIPFGKYTLLRRLARGGMAELYLARSSDDYGVQRMVVLKVIANRYASDDAFSKMFTDEVRIAATLTHPNIGQVVDVGQAGGRQYLAMEHLHGKDVRAIVRQLRRQGRRGVPPHVAVHIGTRICAALQHAHDARNIDGQPLNIIHRDVSPSNIMVNYDGQVKLLDFGIAKAANRVSLTQPGTIKGKVRYLSPEQLLGKPIDRRTDLFTLGVSLWESTVGCHLFEGKQDFQVYDAISKGAVRAPSTLLPGYPPELERIVLKALAFEPDQRYPNARELQADLERYAMRDQLMLSELATSDFVHQLFSDELALWNEAQAGGQSLLDFLMATASQEDQELDSMRTGEEERSSLPPPRGAVAGAIQAKPTASDLPPSSSGSSSGSERKTILFGQGPMSIPGPARAPGGGAPAPGPASVSGPMTVSARGKPGAAHPQKAAGPTGPVAPVGPRGKRGTDPRSLPAQQPALRVSDGAAVELRPEHGAPSVDPSVDESKRPTMIADGPASFGAVGGEVTPPPAEGASLEPADSPKRTILDLGGGPLSARPRAARPAQQPSQQPSQQPGPQPSRTPEPLPAKRGAQLAGGLATAPSEPGRKLTMIDSGAVAVGATANPFGVHPPEPGPGQNPAAERPGPRPAALAATAAPVEPLRQSASGNIDSPVASPPSDGAVPYTPPVVTTVPETSADHLEPVIAEDRAALSAEQQKVEQRARRTGRPQTGDWSHQGRDRRPGTHPFFKGDGAVVEAADLDNPYARGAEAKVRRSRAPIIILIVLVLLLGGGAVAAFFLLRGGDEAVSYKLTSRPSRATVFSAADGRELGKTPLRVAPPGDGKLELHLAGYKVKTLVLTADLHVVLERKEAPAPSKAPPAKEAPAPSKAPPAKGEPSGAKTPAAAGAEEKVAASARKARPASVKRRRPKPAPARKSAEPATPKAKAKKKSERDLKDPFGG